MRCQSRVSDGVTACPFTGQSRTVAEQFQQVVADAGRQPFWFTFSRSRQELQEAPSSAESGQIPVPPPPSVGRQVIWECASHPPVRQLASHHVAQCAGVVVAAAELHEPAVIERVVAT